MAKTLLVLDRQAQAAVFSFGTTGAGGGGLVTINNGTAAASTVGLDVKGSVSIGGDLNITGSVNQVSVNDLYVADLRIRVNRGGTTAGAAGAGLQVEGTSNATIGAIFFDNTTTSKFTIGDGTTQREIVDVSSAQTITNKSIAGSQITGNISGNAGNVTGTVAIANGGTGQTTAVAAFDALSPNTTRGDITVRGVTNNVRLAIGGANTVLKGGTDPSWGAVDLATAQVTGILPGANGGTDNGFFAVTGPTTSLKTFTFPNASATVLTTNAAVTAVQGGTGQTSYAVGDLLYADTTTTLAKLAGVATGNALISGGTNTAPSWGKIGLTTHISGTLAIGNGGTGQTTATAAFDALSPMTALGDLIYGGASGTRTRLAGNTSATKNFLTQTGNGSVSAAPAWGTIAAGDVPNLENLNGTLTVPKGGTGVGSFTAYAVILGGTTSTGNLQTVSGLGTSGQVLTSNGAGAAPTWQAPTGSSAYFHADAVSGTQDSSNLVFTLASAVSANSEQIFVNGQLLNPGSGNDYTISGTTLTFTATQGAPAAADVIRAYGVY